MTPDQHQKARRYMRDLGVGQSQEATLIQVNQGIELLDAAGLHDASDLLRKAVIPPHSTGGPLGRPGLSDSWTLGHLDTEVTMNDMPPALPTLDTSDASDVEIIEALSDATDQIELYRQMVEAARYELREAEAEIARHLRDFRMVQYEAIWLSGIVDRLNRDGRGASITDVVEIRGHVKAIRNIVG